MNIQYIPTNLVDIPEQYEREPAKVRDDIMRKSIAASGVEQPILVLPEGGRYTVVKGTRRVRFARELEIKKVPAILIKVPRNEDPAQYCNRIRFIVSEFRQDLKPSQKGELVSALKDMFNLSHREIADYLGIVPDSVRNWLSVKYYIPEVVANLDAGRLTMQAARAFDGMSEKGQQVLWNKHAQELMDNPANIHKKLRKQYPPQDHADYYRDAKKTIERMSRKGGKRNVTPRKIYGTDEKKKLMMSYEMKEIEAKEAQAELNRLKNEITASIAPIAAIMRNQKLLSQIPKDMQQELARFSEVYC